MGSPFWNSYLGCPILERVIFQSLFSPQLLRHLKLGYIIMATTLLPIILGSYLTACFLIKLIEDLKFNWVHTI